jgi:hypothetical protein
MGLGFQVAVLGFCNMKRFCTGYAGVDHYAAFFVALSPLSKGQPCFHGSVLW